jgi:hypothetical protein
MKRLDPASRAARDLRSGRYVIQTMTSHDMATIAIPWMTEVGWNPGLHDAETFLTTDPEGFHVGLLDGEPIAIVSGVRYDDAFAFLGCYIVRADQRGHGYGLAIHEVARQRLEGCVQGGGWPSPAVTTIRSAARPISSAGSSPTAGITPAR